MYSEKLIKKVEKYVKRSSCSCDECKAMCRKAPCVGSPTWTVEAIKKYGKDKFASTEDAAMTGTGLFHGNIYLVAPRFENGKCIFLDENDLCTIHDDQPEEGAYAHHEIPERLIQDVKEKGLGKVADSIIEVAVRKEWCNPENEKEIMECFRLIDFEFPKMLLYLQFLEPLLTGGHQND